jgi:hypothetical protein
MSQPPSNLPPGLSFGRRTTAPVKLPRLEFPRLGGPLEGASHRTGEPSGLTHSPGEQTSETSPFVAQVPPQTSPSALAQTLTQTSTPVPTQTPVQTSTPVSTRTLSQTSAQMSASEGPVLFIAPFQSATPQAPPSGPIRLGAPPPAPQESYQSSAVKEEQSGMMTSNGIQVSAIPDAQQAARVIVYGKSGSAPCMQAIQDLMERQVSFQYYDVSRDANAAAHLRAICNGDPVVPVIVYIGFGGAF